MRHFLSLRSVALLAPCVHPSTARALLILPPRGTLPRSSPSPSALRIAVPSARDIAQRAQRHHATAPGIPAADDV